MTSTITVKYTQDELDAMIKVLNLLCQFDDDADDHVITVQMRERSERAFDNLSELLMMDPAGDRLFVENGW